MVSVLLVTHGNIGESLLDAAEQILGSLPLQTDALSVSSRIEPEVLSAIAKRKIEQLDQGHGILIMTDLYGATPHNIAKHLSNHHIAVVSGLNLSMLLRTMNYCDCDLDSLSHIAETGGHVGIKCENYVHPALQHALPIC